MIEIIFLVEEAPEGGYTACALGGAVCTEANTAAELRDAAREAVRCHFPDAEQAPQVIRLRFVREEVFAA